MTASKALCSHDPLYFAVNPQERADMTQQTASRLSYISAWKLDSESAGPTPNLRRMLGHCSVHERTQDFTKPQARPSPVQVQVQVQVPTNELSTYLQQVPSFRDFQAAIEVQLATMASITAATAQLKLMERNSREIEEDSDDDSYDGDWSDMDAGAESDDSSTDDESHGVHSECGSPTSYSGEGGQDEEADGDLWALRPLTPLMREQLGR